jgi:hypothetical protein
MRFWFHYNRQASAAAGAPRLSLHYRGRCHLVSSLDVRCRTWSRARTQQPRLVICGDAERIEIGEDGAAIIT